MHILCVYREGSMGNSVALPKGAITQISGHGKTEFVVQWIAEHSDLRVAWIEDGISIFPYGFLQRRVSLHRVLFIEAESHFNWVVLEILRSQTFPVVVVYVENLELKVLRRIQLASEKCDITTLWLSKEPRGFFPISLQLQIVKSDSGLKTNVLRQRGSLNFDALSLLKKK